VNQQGFSPRKMTDIVLINSPERYATLSAFVQQRMTRDVDYGIVPGTNSKPTLLKPGAEKLCRLFGLSADINMVYSVEDFTGKEHGEPLFYYRYRCILTWQQQMIATCEGSCNSWEKKYRYRDEKPACPKCRARAIRKSDLEFYCWRKLEGCGAKFPLNYSEIASQPIGKVFNDEIFDQINTLQKMAQKRSLVGAVLVATGASEFFTQDLD
jgi:hypothetical protein